MQRSYVVSGKKFEYLKQVSRYYSCSMSSNSFENMINKFANFDMAEIIVEEDLPENKDISGLETAADVAYSICLTKKWVKLIPLHKTISFDDYNRKENFIYVADIVRDDDVCTSGKKKGGKKRNSVIKFLPKISKEDFYKKTEWIYLLTINNRILKFGGTRGGLSRRASSYLCGHHIKERGKSGDCSKTNGFVYNTFAFYLNLGCKIQMYAYELPKTEIIVEILGKQTKIIAQTYHAYETVFLEDYKTQNRHYPPLNDNCDPDYKKHF